MYNQNVKDNVLLKYRSPQHRPRMEVVKAIEAILILSYIMDGQNERRSKQKKPGLKKVLL